MSTSGADRGNNSVVEDDCPLCLEPLPPFWDLTCRLSLVCCGKEVCKRCMNKTQEFLDRARAEGTFGEEEEQLSRFCPLCRSETPEGLTEEAANINAAAAMIDRFNAGRLPLRLYRELGLCYLIGCGGVRINIEKGMELLMLGAERGDPNCQCLIGDRYIQGSDGLPKSPKDAKRWWLAAAKQGHAVAEYNLAIMFRDEGNDAEYLRYMTDSASHGYDQACYNLGHANYTGEHTAQKSTEEAIRVLTPAVERGDAGCMRLLGIVMCIPDPDLPPSLPRDNPNFTEGVHWLRRAAGMGGEASIKQLRTVEEVVSGMCFMCNEEAPPEKAFLRCSRCRAAWYCSKDCQVQHWKAEEGGHKQVCIKWFPQK